MSRLRVGLLANSSAASGTAHRAGRQAAHLLRVAGISVVDLSGPTAAIAKARALEVRDSLTALVVVGGDGTIALGAEIVERTPVRLGVVAAGSGNDFARAMDLPIDDAPESVRGLLHAMSRPVVAIDAIEITSALPEGPPLRSLALGNLNMGFDALVNARANRATRPGSTRYTLSVLQELRRFAPLPYTISVDGGEAFDLDASMLTLTNTGVMGGGMRLVPDALVDDGYLSLVSLTGIGRGELLRFFPRVFRGAHVSVKGFDVRRVREITVGLRDEEMSLRTYADGDARTLLPVSARILPGAVRILAEIPAQRSAGLGAGPDIAPDAERRPGPAVGGPW